MKEKQVTVEVEVSKAIDHMWKPVFAGLFVLALCGGVYLAYGAYAKHQEKGAQEELFALQKRVETQKETLEKAEAAASPEEAAKDKKKMPPKKEVAKKTEPKTPETLQKHYGDILKDYMSFISTHPGKKASYMAAVQAAGLALSYQDFSAAEKALSEVATKVKPKDIFFGLVKSQLGSVQMDQKKYPQAVAEYQDLISSPAQSYFHPVAKLRLGVCYVEMGDFGQAESTFEKLLADHPTTQAANEARNMKKLIALRRGDQPVGEMK